MLPGPAETETAVGASGGVGGAAWALEVPVALVPTELVAVTVKVYVVPGLRPFTVVDVPAVPRSVHPPHAGEGVTVYPEIDAPLPEEAFHETVISLSPAVGLEAADATTPVGALGMVLGMIAPELPAALGPTELVAVTEKV
jgi:hypothetical protein